MVRLCLRFLDEATTVDLAASHPMKRSKLSSVCSMLESKKATQEVGLKSSTPHVAWKRTRSCQPAYSPPEHAPLLSGPPAA